MRPPTDGELVKTAEAWAARHGEEEGEKVLRMLRSIRQTSERHHLTEEEAMESANSELRAMRAERADREAEAKAGR